MRAPTRQFARPWSVWFSSQSSVGSGEPLALMTPADTPSGHYVVIRSLAITLPVLVFPTDAMAVRW